MLRALLVYLFIAVYLLVAAPVGMVWCLLTGRTSFLYAAARLCVRAAGLMSGVRVRIRGLEKLAPGHTYVFLSNHQGNFDGPVLLHSVPRDIRALIKKEMMQIPILSLVMRQVGFVPIDRHDPEGARASIERGGRLLRAGHSFIAFPEGTRSRTGQLQPFKKGVFVMALRGAAPVVPITIVGSRDVQPPGAFAIRPGVIDVIFHDPIETVDLGLEGRDELIERTRRAIASALPGEAGAQPPRPVTER